MNLPSIVDGVDAYLQSIKHTEMLTKENEYMLAMRVWEHNDRSAAEKIIISHLPLAAKIARGYKKYGMPYGDLIGEANIGLIKAMNKFNPEKGFRFSTYAMLWIKANIQEYIIRTWSLVKIGSTNAQQRLFYGLEKTKKRLGIARISADNVGKISTAFNIPEDKIYEMDSRLCGDSSLNVVINFDGDGTESKEFQDLLEDSEDHVENILDEHEHSYQLSKLNEAIDTLLPRYQTIIRRRHLSDPPATLTELATEFEVSRERIRQIEANAMQKIKRYISQNGN